MAILQSVVCAWPVKCVDNTARVCFDGEKCFIQLKPSHTKIGASFRGMSNLQILHHWKKIGKQEEIWTRQLCALYYFWVEFLSFVMLSWMNANLDIMVFFTSTSCLSRIYITKFSGLNFNSLSKLLLAIHGRFCVGEPFMFRTSLLLRKHETNSTMITTQSLHLSADKWGNDIIVHCSDNKRASSILGSTFQTEPSMSINCRFSHLKTIRNHICIFWGPLWTTWR